MVVTVVQPAITLSKTVTPTTVSKAGDLVTYTFVAQNTGNVELSGVTITDDKLPGLVWGVCSMTTLKPDASLTCNASYQVTQADIDAGSILNSATASGTSAKGVQVSATADATVGGSGSSGSGSLADTGADGWMPTGVLLALLAIAFGVLMYRRAQRVNG